jgi:hypothetical protein
MVRLRRSIFLSVAVTAALAPAATAPAATTAQRFADAVEHGKSALRAKEPEFRAATKALNFGKCERVLERKPPPERETDRFAMFLVAAMFGPMFEPAKPVLHQIVADLDAIPTRDPILKSGRAGWRVTVQYFDRFPRIEAPCDQLEKWANSGWRASARPEFDFEAFERLVDGEGTGVDLAGRKIERAARRMRQLGVSKGDAKRFTGETLFDEIPDDVVESEAVESSPPLR